MKRQYKQARGILDNYEIIDTNKGTFEISLYKEILLYDNKYKYWFLFFTIITAFNVCISNTYGLHKLFYDAENITHGMFIIWTMLCFVNCGMLWYFLYKLFEIKNKMYNQSKHVGYGFIMTFAILILTIVYSLIKTPSPIWNIGLCILFVLTAHIKMIKQYITQY